MFKRYLDTNRYVRIRLFDDDLNNLKSFLSLKSEYPQVSFTGYQVLNSGNMIQIQTDY